MDGWTDGRTDGRMQERKRGRERERRNEGREERRKERKKERKKEGKKEGRKKGGRVLSSFSFCFLSSCLRPSLSFPDRLSFLPSCFPFHGFTSFSLSFFSLLRSLVYFYIFLPSFLILVLSLFLPFLFSFPSLQVFLFHGNELLK